LAVERNASEVDAIVSVWSALFHNFLAEAQLYAKPRI
jgi:hypothetical protein